MAIVLVGAMIVSSIHTVWHGPVCPHARQIQTFTYEETDAAAIQLNKGDELGHFRLGSTVIILFAPNQMQWNEAINSGTTVRFGEAIGRTCS